MARSVIVGAVRTPFGRLGGGLAARSATELGAIAIRAALERAGIEPQRAAVRVSASRSTRRSLGRGALAGCSLTGATNGAPCVLPMNAEPVAG